MRWFWCLIRMPTGHFLDMPEGILSLSNGRMAQGRPRTWRDYISYLVWEYLRIPQEEQEDVGGERNIVATFRANF